MQLHLRWRRKRRRGITTPASPIRTARPCRGTTATTCTGNSHGFLEGYSSSRNSVSCVVIAEDSSGMQRDYWYSTARDPAHLEPASQIGMTAARRTLRRLGARKLDTRTAPVLYDSDIARGVIGHFVSAVRGSNLYRKASFLLDRLGERVMADHVRIHEQPHIRGALASAAFDGEGVATSARDLITGGVLRGYVLDSYSARKLGVETTGNAGGVHNLTVDPGPKSFEALLAEMDTGLLVTELMGMGINIVTGGPTRGGRPASGSRAGRSRIPSKRSPSRETLRTCSRGFARWVPTSMRGVRFARGHC